MATIEERFAAFNTENPVEDVPVASIVESPDLASKFAAFNAANPVESIPQPMGVLDSSAQPSTDDRSTLELFGEAVVKPAAIGLGELAGSLVTDPEELLRSGIDLTLETGGALLKAILDTKFQTALSIGGELTAKRIPVVGGALKDIAGIAGATVGKVFEEDKGVSEAFREALKEQIAGRVIAKVGGKIIKVGSANPKQLIKDATISREVAENTTRTFNEATKQLGITNLPSVFSVKGEFGSKLGENLKIKINKAAVRGGGIGNTTFFQDVIQGTQKTFEKAVSKGTKTPDFKKLDSTLRNLTREATDKRLDGIGEIADANNVIAAKSKAPLNVEGMSTLADEIALKTGAGIKGNKDAQEVFKIVNSVLRDKSGNAKDVLTLKEWSSIEAQLENLSSKFGENRARQASVDGIIGRVKNELIEPLETGMMALAKTSPHAVHPDIATYISNKKVVKAAYTGLDEVLGTKLAQVGGKTQIAQAKKAANETKFFKDAVSSAESYRQTVKLMGEVAPEAIKLLDDRIIVDTLATIKGKGGVITAEGVTKAIGTAVQPSARREVLEAVNPALVQTLENIRLVQEGVESFAAKATGETGEESTSALFTKLVTGKLADQQLVAGIAKKNLIAKQLNRVLGGVSRTDAPLLKKLSGKEGLELLEKATPFRVFDDGAYNTYRQIITAAGVRPVNNDEFLQTMREYVEATKEFTGEENPQLLEILLSE